MQQKLFPFEAHSEKWSRDHAATVPLGEHKLSMNSARPFICRKSEKRKKWIICSQELVLFPNEKDVFWQITDIFIFRLKK